MDISEQYDELEVIKENEYKKISLVRSQIDHLLYLKREIVDYNKEIYNQLVNIDSIYLPKIYGVQEQHNKIIAIEEYINAPTLEEVLLNEQISKEKALNIFCEVCKAVQELHQLVPPIIHRDIKPSNIFYDRGKIYLFDFDISRNYQIQKNKDTRILGSVGYAAPEQFGFGQSNKQSDIYALGVLLNVLLTNKLPNESMYVGSESKVIRKAISIDPTQRYTSVDRMVYDLGIKYKKYDLTSLFLSLPGIRNDSRIKKILASIGYICLFMFCFSASITHDGVLVTGAIAWAERLYMYVMFMTIILVGGDYLDAHKQCFFYDSNYKIVRVMGIILFIVLLIFLELICLELIVIFFEIG